MFQLVCALLTMNPLKLGFGNSYFQHCLIKFCPHKSLNFGVFKLHITNHYGHHLTIGKIMHMISHSCPTNNTLHMIKRDQCVLQARCMLHSCEKVDSTPNTIYRHLKIKHLLSLNLSWETTFLDVVIMTFGFQLKDVINITTS
jgi:hypothetical protein